MAFEGYLIAYPHKETVNGVQKEILDKFPLKYVDEGSYQCTPNQREEIKAYRDDNTRALTRITATGMKTKIEITTRPNLSETDIEYIINWLNTRYTIVKERKIYLKYWNHESMAYKYGYFYLPDIVYKIKSIHGNNIKYDAFDLHFIEY